MPRIKIVCSDKIPLPQGQLRNKPGACFKLGLRAGFAAGIQKGTKTTTEQGIKRAKIVKAIPKAALQIQVKRGIRKAQETIAKRAETAAQERENALMSANDVNIEPPRVRNPARRQQFRNFYGLDRAAAVVAQNPVGAPLDDRPSISQILNRLNPKVNGKKQLNDGDLLISNGNFNVPELTRNQKKAMGVAGFKRYLKETKGYRD